MSRGGGSGPTDAPASSPCGLSGGGRSCCPCCGGRTLTGQGSGEVCPVCFWEDGGPNGGLTLTAARANYRAIGACEERFAGYVRPPRPDEVAG